ncbi:hypothetical protein BDK51DRAFT_47963 [Blyttiomyces helicus]|uniref:Uncharacterized protein n=1 Tax=Blyttiomyces helicus TaxID=388810 RepID=A0A4P9WGB1_9FUNG|nr:hypothetical protein BDK51DRAFT_47963 [Blyttiomyces helicus]|eukprot:RKO91734.1 hypothetical protein BDK51DRAFT_47963 [Blyttiomyces helicus]
MTCTVALGHDLYHISGTMALDHANKNHGPMTPLFLQSDDSDVGDAEHVCTAEPAPSRPLRRAMDDHAAEDDDEAGQAILLEQVQTKTKNHGKTGWWTRMRPETQIPLLTVMGAKVVRIATTKSGRRRLIGHSPFRPSAASPALLTSSLVADIPDLEKDLLQVLAIAIKQQFTRARLPPNLQGPQLAGAQKLVKVMTLKLPTLLPLPPIVSRSDFARICKHHPKLSKCICNAAEDTNRQLPPVCTFTMEKEVRNWCDRRCEAHGLRPNDCGDNWWVSLWAMQKEWKLLHNKAIADGIALHFLHCFLFTDAFSHYGQCKASLTVLTATAAELLYPMQSNGTFHALMPISILDDPQLDQIGLHTWTCILVGNLALLAKGLLISLHAHGGAVFLISVP